MESEYSKTLVTGGAGFIGSHIVKRLLDDDFEVTVIDDLSVGMLESTTANQRRSGFRFLKGDIRDKAFVKKALKDVEVVFHEAAFVGGPQSVEKPLLTNEINVNGTLNLLAESLKSGVNRFVFASSAAVYGDQGKSSAKENLIPHPSSPYAASKLASEHYLEAYHKAYGLETVSLRYFNVYGPGQRYGPYAAVITAFVNHLARGESPTIYGDGEQSRDFINVEDVVEANMLAMKKDCAGNVFNVSTGCALTINELFVILRNLTKRSRIKPVYSELRLSDIRYSCGDSCKAKEIMGFVPRVRLELGLMELVKAQKKMLRTAI